MQLNDTRFSFALLAILASLGAAAAACGGSDQQGTGNFGGWGGAGGTVGCVQPQFPAGQPDLNVLKRPLFLLTTSIAQQSQSGQAQVRPGDPVEAEVSVNDATRQVRVEVANVREPDEGDRQIIYDHTYPTGGGETIAVDFDSPDNVRGRFYMRLTLCALDCNEQEVVFDINPNADSPYERTVIERGREIRVDKTCIILKARPDEGSGTVVIQN